MELIKAISNKDLGLKHKNDSKYKLRKASRIILFDKNKIAILDVTKNKYHKLPGGGIEEGEDVLDALKREIKEETGCIAEIGKEVGMIIEIRDDYGLIQFSFCYIGQVLKKGKTDFTDKEKNQGFVLEWIDIKEAIKILEKDKPVNYEGKFIVKRDLAFLKKAYEIIKKS